MAAPSVDLTNSSMVSHTFSERGFPVRAPSSVTSHSSKHTRRHRSSRSHTGGSSYTPQNEFPNFAHTGDVDITVVLDGQEKKYLLHRLILAQCSGFFETSTSEEWSGQDGSGPAGAVSSQGQIIDQGLSVIGEEAKTDPRMTLQLPNPRKKPFWRYELDPGTGPDDIPMLIRRNGNESIFGGGSSPQPRPPPARSKPPASSNGFFRTMAAMQSVVHVPGAQTSLESNAEPLNDTLRDYDNLFRIFYNYPPNLDAVSITEAYIQSKTLITLADMYDALEVVGPRIDHHLLQFSSRLWKQIAKYPPSYLKLGYLARSKTIFSEALTHVVGQWPAGQVQLRNVPRPVLDLIEDKADDLDELRARLEGQLFRLTLTTTKGERAAPNSPNNLDWMAVSLFRHWLVENLPPPPTPIIAGLGTTANPNSTGQKSVTFDPSASQGPAAGPANAATGIVPRSSLIPATGRAFRLLGQAGQAYLPHEELKKYIKTHLDPSQYDRTQLKRFEKRMDDLKLQAQTIVRSLTRNALQMDIGSREGGGLGYLTCVGVGDGEWPW